MASQINAEHINAEGYKAEQRDATSGDAKRDNCKAKKIRKAPNRKSVTTNPYMLTTSGVESIAGYLGLLEAARLTRLGNRGDVFAPNIPVK